MTRENYFVERNHQTDEIIYLEYDKILSIKATYPKNYIDIINSTFFNFFVKNFS